MESTPRNRDPWLVAIDAATMPASLAVLRGESILAQRTSPPTFRTDAWLQPTLDESLGQLGVALDEIEGYAVTVGPGTFTGIRVGLATCLGLAAPRRLPVVGVQTLEALAERGRAPTSPWVVACLDARRREVYGALYRLDAPPTLPLEPKWGPAACAPRDLIDNVGEHAAEASVAGNGWELLEPLAPPGLSPARFDGAAGPTLAAAAGLLVARSWATSPRWPPPEPFYVRPADARPPVNPLLRASEQG